VPVQREKAEHVAAAERSRAGRPLVWINEIPWNEMNVGDDLTLLLRGAWAQGDRAPSALAALPMRRMPGDMIVDAYIVCPLVIHSKPASACARTVDIVRHD